MDDGIKQSVVTLRILYPVWIVISIYALMYVPSLLMTGDAVETARNIADNTLFFRSALLAAMFTQLIHVLVVILLRALFYENGDPDCLFNLTVFGLLGVPIALSSPVAGLAILDNLSDMTAVSGYLAWMKHSETIASLFWGMWLFPLGNLAVNSGFFPGFIRWVLWGAGLGYLVGIVVKILIPEQTSILALTDVMAMGELVFVFWFVVFGVRLKFET